MLLQSKEQLDQLLVSCRAKAISDIGNGGKFYKIKAQNFLFPDGTIQTREYIDKHKASLVVPLTDEGNLVFVLQPIALADTGSLIEFPAGYWEFLENGKNAGIRELAEETGYLPREIINLGSHYQDPGSIRQKVETYLAIGCKKVKEQTLDKGEFIKCIEVPFELALDLMDENYFMDANTFIALSKSIRVLEKNKELSNSINCKYLIKK